MPIQATRIQVLSLVVSACILVSTVEIRSLAPSQHDSVLVQSQTGSVPLTNQDVVRMSRAGISQETILVLVRRSPSAFQLDPDSVIALKAQGLSDEVIRAMAEAKTEKTPTQPEAVPISVPSVGIFRPGSIVGCVGTVEVSADRIAWKDTKSCWTRDVVEVNLSSVSRIVFEDVVVRVGMDVWDANAARAMHMSLSSSGARKIYNYLSEHSPKLAQECRVVTALSSEQYRDVACSSWAR